MKNKTPLKNKKAFSLLELIFVIVIIAIIATVAVPKFLDTRDSALATTIKRDINSIITSIQTYYLINHTLDKISQSITLDSSVWEEEDKKVIFKDKEKNCIIIEVLENTNSISLTINSDVSTTCTKINELGIDSRSYQLY